jgi:hypothetical protein
LRININLSSIRLYRNHRFTECLPNTSPTL